MKKIGMIAVLFILTFSFSVKAEVFMEFDCNDVYDITKENNLTCSGVLAYEVVSISDIEFDYDTNLDIKFTEISGFSLSKSGNKISIHAETPLYDEILNSTDIFKFTLSVNDNVKEKETVTFKNIKINKSNEEEIEDISQSFNVELEEILDNNSFLDSITIDKVLVPGFDKNKFEYSGITVSSNVVNIDAVRSSETSTVTGLGGVHIKPGETITHTILVVAADNTKKEYKLTITNTSTKEVEGNIEPISEQSKDNTLKTLELYDGKEKINFNFNSKSDTYNIKIDKEIEKLTIKATLNDSNATFISEYGPRDVKLTSGDNKILIKTKAQNGEAKIYTLNINVKDTRDKDTSLKSLKINGETINLVDKVYKYEITVTKDILKTEIEVLPTSDKAKVDYKDIELSSGDNKVIIKVTAENGDKKEYTVNVIQSEEDSVDNSLQNISVEGYDLGFSSDKKNYVLKVSNDTDSLKIVLKPSNIEYEVLGNNNLENDSVVTIKLGDDTEYKITIKKDISKTNPIVYIIAGITAILLIVVIIYLIRKKRKNNNVEII